jgi:hypothetical protein
MGVEECCRILIGRAEMAEPLGKIGEEGVYWIKLAQNRDQ